MKIDFYILPETNTKARFELACRLIEKAYKNRHRVFVHTDSQQDAHLLDEMLWTYKDDSFIPHNLYGDGPEPAPPIQIGFMATPEKHRDILLNLTKDIPPFYQQFHRVLELIPAVPELQERGRENYKMYRAAGHEITTHKLSVTA